jgi:hypothetical protein
MDAKLNPFELQVLLLHEGLFSHVTSCAAQEFLGVRGYSRLGPGRLP